MRYFLELRYNGAAYCGWQRQPDMPSVQQTLERALSTLLRGKIEVTGAGRTDTGVNASYYVAHFDCAEPVPDPAQVVYKLNFLLPGDIAVGSMTPVGADAHARFAAREREYRYYIEPRKNPFTRDATWQYYVPLDMDRMNEAAAALLEYDDFTSFAKLNSNNKTNICRGMDGRRTWRALLHDPRRPFSAQHGPVAGRDAGRCGTRALYARRLPRDRREPRPFAVERRRSGAGVVSERRGLPARRIRTKNVLLNSNTLKL